MQTIIEYFRIIPSSHRTALLVGGITLFWLIESAAPLFQFKNNKWKHAGVNVFFTLTTILVNFPLAFLLVKASDWAIGSNFGIMQWLPQLPTWLYALVGLMLLDLIGAWLVHWTEHRIKWMWRFSFNSPYRPTRRYYFSQ